MKGDLKIDWATHKAAKYACENWHYSKCLPVGKVTRVGVWEKERFIGVVLFSRGAAPKLFAKYGLNQENGCELTRIALRDHVTPVSRVMAIALKFLKKTSPGLRLVISFADPEQGHHGGIYQATNWIYVGESSKVPSWVDLRGRKWHHRTVCDRAAKISGKHRGYKRIMVPGKYKYLMPLDKEMREQIMPLSKPYPKRAVSVVESTSGYQSDSGGSNPTTAHQFDSSIDPLG